MQHGNLYTSSLGRLFDAIPKTVIGAVAVSFGTTGGDCLEEAAYRIAKEWGVLHSQGIVSQPLTKEAKDAIIDGDARGFSSAF